MGDIDLTPALEAGKREEPADDDWHQAYLDAGYIWCRPCREYHRPPECAIDEQGRALAWDGTPWEEMP